MAREALTIAGAAIGFYFGGPAGAAFGAQLGGFVGGIVDPADPIQGPRLSDLQVTASTYGTPIPLIYGPTNRIAGNVIWSTGLIETKSKKKAGGKGGGGQTVEEYSYRMSLAVALGQGPIHGITRIWANSKLLFDVNQLSQAPGAPTADVGMVVVTGTGFKGVGITEGVQAGGTFSILRFYQGNGTQQIDPTIEAHEGAGNVPAYRHTSYLVIQDLQLADYGNSMPNLEVEVIGQESITVADVVSDICERAGVDSVSTSGLGTALRGYVVAQAGPAFQALVPLARAYAFDVAEQGGQIRAIPRGRGMRGVVPIGDMGAAEPGGNRPEPIRYETLTDLQMPQEVSVSYSDPAMDYQVNTQRATRAAGSSENNIRREIPLVLTADEARRLADRELWEAWAGRRTARSALSDRWVRRQPADVLGLPVAGAIVPHRLLRATRGHDGVLEVDWQYDDPEVYSSDAAGAAANIPANPIQLPGFTRLVLMDMPIVRQADDDAGFYWAVSAENAGWRGAQILRSSDGGENYNLMSPVAVRAVLGDVATALPAGPSEIWDRGNTLTVELHFSDDQLESLSELAVLNGGNAAWLGPADGQGGEIIQFATATLVATDTYELTDLLRGRLGTEHAIGTHGADEVFVLLEPDTLGRSEYGAGDWERERLYKPVSNLIAEVDTASQTFTNTGVGKKPLSPVHVDGTRDGGNDLTITWVRRSRLRVPGLGYGPVPLGEETEAYEVDILAGSPAAVVRILEASTPSAVYTAAQQTTDGLTPGDPVAVVVYQLSGSRGRGFGASATV